MNTCEAWKTSIRQGWRDPPRQGDYERGGAKCHLSKLRLDPGTTGGPSTLLRGNDTVIFHLREERMIVSTQGTVGEVRDEWDISGTELAELSDCGNSREHNSGNISVVTSLGYWVDGDYLL